MHRIGRLVTLAILTASVHSAAMADLVNNKDNTIALPETLGGTVNILAGAKAPDDCDDIRLTSVPRTGPSPTIRLRTASNMWGKKAEIFVDGNRIGTLDAAGNGGTSARVSLVPSQLYRTQVHLLKPKAFGAMTGVYQIVGLSRFASRDITILWQDDHC